MVTFSLILLITALILFLLAAFGVGSKIGLMPLGLACLTGAQLLQGVTVLFK